MMNANADETSLPHDTLTERIYEPDSLRKSGIAIWVQMFRQLIGSVVVVWRLMKRDISVRYRQSVLGYVWAILPPVATVAIFAFLFSRRVLPIGDTPIPYVPFVLWNISVWQLFAGVLGGATGSLAAVGPMISKVNFPKEALVIASIGQPLFDFIIRMIPVTLAFAWFGIPVGWQFLWLPMLLVPVLVMAAGLGFLLSVFNLAIRDIGNGLGMLLMFGMFLAPVLYPPPVTAPFYLVNVLNPFSPLLIATQDVLAGNPLTYPDLLAASTLFSLLIFLAGWRVFYLIMPRVVAQA